MERSHLLLIDMPRLLRDIVVEALSGATDIELVGELEGHAAAAALHSTDVDFAILGHDDTRLATDLLAVAPSLTLLAVVDDGRDAALWELRPRKMPLGELSPERLVTIIRQSRTTTRLDRAPA